MERFWIWLADSPIASALKFTLAAVLSWVLVNLDTFGLPTVVGVAAAAFIPFIINWANPADTRFGIGSKFPSE